MKNLKMSKWSAYTHILYNIFLIMNTNINLYTHTASLFYYNNNYIYECVFFIYIHTHACIFLKKFINFFIKHILFIVVVIINIYILESKLTIIKLTYNC